MEEKVNTEMPVLIHRGNKDIAERCGFAVVNNYQHVMIEVPKLVNGLTITVKVNAKKNLTFCLVPIGEDIEYCDIQYKQEKKSKFIRFSDGESFNEESELTTLLLSDEHYKKEEK